MSENDKAITALDFASLLSEADVKFDNYNAYKVENCLFGIFERTLKEALEKRENALKFSFQSWDDNQPPVNFETSVFREAIELIESLPWVASVHQVKSDGVPRLDVYIQNPENGRPLFPEKLRRWDIIHYPVLVAEKEQQEALEKAQSDAEFTHEETGYIQKFIGLFKKDKAAASLPAPQEAQAPAPKKPTLLDEFNAQAKQLKSAVTRIPNLDIDQARMEHLLQQIPKILSENDEMVSSIMNRSHLRRAKHEITILTETFNDFGDVVALAQTAKQSEFSLTEEKLDALRSNFNMMMNVLEETVQKAIGQKMEHADIGLEVHTGRLAQMERLDNISISPEGKFTFDRD